MTEVNIYDQTFNWFDLQRFKDYIVVGANQNSFELRTRDNVGASYGVPYFRSSASDQPTAFDVMPSGTGGANVSGKSWVHVLNSDISDGSHNWEAFKIGAHLDRMECGSDAGGAGVVRKLNIGGAGIRFLSRVGGGIPEFWGQFSPNGSFQLGAEATPHVIFYSNTLRIKGGYKVQMYSGDFSNSSPDVGFCRSSAGFIKITNGGDGSGSMSLSVIVTAPVTVGQLPTTSDIGSRSFVTDALSNEFGSAVAGGGSFKTPVYFDGQWRVG